MKKLMIVSLLGLAVLMAVLMLGLGFASAFGFQPFVNAEAFFGTGFVTVILSGLAGILAANRNDSWPWWIERRLQERKLRHRLYMKELAERERVLQRAGLDFNP